MPERVFLGWDRPLAESVGEWVGCHRGPSPACVDLSHLLVLVPIRQAIPALESAIATHHPACLSPRILTPQLLPHLDPALAARLPDRRTQKVHWMEIMKNEGDALLTALRPVRDAPPPTHWISTLADEILSLHEELIRHGWSFAEAARHLTVDRVRWEALAGLENRWEDRLTAAGTLPPSQTWGTLAPSSFETAGIDHVVIAGIPDLIPAARKVLDPLPASSVTVLIAAPESESPAFNPWGNPDPDRWTGPLAFPNFDQQVHLLRNDEDLIDQAESLVLAHDHPEACCITSARDDLRTAIESRLDDSDVPHLNMAGHPASPLPLASFLFHFSNTVRSPTRSNLFSLLIHPWMDAVILEAFGTERIDDVLEAWDHLLQNHPWQQLDDLEHMSPLRREDRAFPRRLHAFWSTWLKPFRSSTGIGAFRTLLSTQPWDQEIPRDDVPQVAQALEFWFHPERMTTSSLLECLEFCLSDLQEIRLFDSSGDAGLRLHGWIDSAWSLSPHLIVAGLQDDSIPRRAYHHLFLTRPAARELGFASDAALHACDAFLLQMLIHSRTNHGRIDLLVSRSDLEGNPLLPSRLLAIAEPRELSGRITGLFTLPAPGEDSGSGVPVPFHLPGPQAPGDKKTSVTAFRRYLESPFYFYLTDILGWETMNTDHRSMDPLQYGTLTHRALELFLRETQEAPLRDPPSIEAALLRHLDHEFRHLVGDSPHLGLEIQVESIRSRLRTYASHEAALRNEGWMTIDVEKKIHLPVGDWTITGKIDRIDQHPDGRIRILDYKTSDKPEAPAKAHLKALRSNTVCQEVAIFAWRGKEHCWTNLQLPLYAASLLPDFPDDTPIEVGYVQLAKAAEDTGVDVWNDFDRDLISSALACASAILGQIDAAAFEDPLVFDAHERDLWYRLLGPDAFECFQVEWAPARAAGGSHA